MAEIWDMQMTSVSRIGKGDKDEIFIFHMMRMNEMLGSPSSSVQRETILERAIWQFAARANGHESLFPYIGAEHGR
jgi:hypothetical protein